VEEAGLPPRCSTDGQAGALPPNVSLTHVCIVVVVVVVVVVVFVLSTEEVVSHLKRDMEGHFEIPFYILSKQRIVLQHVQSTLHLVGTLYIFCLLFRPTARASRLPERRAANPRRK